MCVRFIPVPVRVEYEAVSQRVQAERKMMGFLLSFVVGQWNTFGLYRPPSRRGLDFSAFLKGVAKDGRMVRASVQGVP
jgi:hypothetical protein